MTGDANGEVPGGALRFALLAHSHPVPGYPAPHFDLLLEDPALPGADSPGGGRCRTWRLRADPRFDAPTGAQPLPPHRAHYLEYEGPVTGGRGTVRRLDGGELAWGYGGVATLSGRFLTGRWAVRNSEFGPA